MILLINQLVLKILLIILAHEKFARLAELADALDLGSSEATRGGSTPLSRTLYLLKIQSI